jgi:hypothetical protein
LIDDLRLEQLEQFLGLIVDSGVSDGWKTSAGYSTTSSSSSPTSSSSVSESFLSRF